MNFADLSHHQDTLDVSTYRSSRPRIALKISEGNFFTDPAFRGRWLATGAVHMPRIGYHYARVASSGRDNFVKCLDGLSKAGGGFTSRDRLCLDVEDVTGHDGNGFVRGARQNAIDFVRAAVAAGFEEGIIYSGNWYLRPNGIVASDFPAGWRNLWISEYSDKSDATITVPVGWAREHIVARQYTDRAHVLGVSGTCDDSRVLRDWLTIPSVPTNGKVDLVAGISLDDIGTEMTGRLDTFKKQHLDGTLDRVKEMSETDLPAIEERLTAIEAKLNATP